MVRQIALALCALWLPECQAKSQGLRRARFIRKMRGFEDLGECEVAFDKLEVDCAKPHHARPGENYENSVAKAAHPRGGLASDERGDGYRNSANHFAGAGGKAYAAPDGWDYRQHGADWDHLGQCGADKQSPIDLAKYVDVQGQTKYVLWFDYYLDPDLEQKHRAKVINDGHGLRYNVQDNGVDLGFVKLGTQEYAAAEYQFHAPSEHTMDGAVFPLELQVINKEHGSGGIVAVSILFREGESNKFLAGLKDGLNGQAPTWTARDGRAVGTLSGLFPDAFDLEQVVPKTGVSKEHTFYNYEGSLTQPPCTPGVDWWVLSTPVTATREEIRFVRQAIFSSPSMPHGNARDTMPIDGRSIWVGLTGFQHAIKYHNLPSWHDKDALQSPRGYSTQDLPWGDHWAVGGPGPSPGPAPGPGAAPGR